MGIVMSLGYYPQAYRIIKTHSAKDISISTYVIFSIGTVVWTAYGIYTRDIVVILGFVIGVIGSWSVLFLSIKYRNKTNNSL